jgi:hypothetical protein
LLVYGMFIPLRQCLGEANAGGAEIIYLIILQQLWHGDCVQELFQRPLQQAQAMARHSDPKTTMVYFHNLNRLQAGAERFILF